MAQTLTQEDLDAIVVAIKASTIISDIADEICNSSTRILYLKGINIAANDGTVPVVISNQATGGVPVQLQANALPFRGVELYETDNLTKAPYESLLTGGEWGKVVAKRRDYYPCGGWTGFLGAPVSETGNGGIFPADSTVAFCWKGWRNGAHEWLPILDKPAMGTADPHGTVFDGHTWISDPAVYALGPDPDPADVATNTAFPIPEYAYLQLSVAAGVADIPPINFKINPTGLDASDCSHNAIRFPGVMAGKSMHTFVRSDGHAVVPYGTYHDGDFDNTLEVKKLVNMTGHLTVTSDNTPTSLSTTPALPLDATVAIELSEANLSAWETAVEKPPENTPIEGTDPIEYYNGATWVTKVLTAVFERRMVYISVSAPSGMGATLCHVQSVSDLQPRIGFTLPALTAGQTIRGWVMSDGSFAPYSKSDVVAISVGSDNTSWTS